MNHFYNIWNDAVKGKSTFFPIKINWWEHPERDENFKRNMIRDRGITYWNQEFACLSSYSFININKNGKEEKITLKDFWSSLEENY